MTGAAGAAVQFARATPVAFALTFGLAACGKTTVTASASGAASDASVPTEAIPASPCPAVAEVTDNAPCSREGVVCEVGASPDLDCNTRYTCTTDPTYGTYYAEERRRSCGSCPEASAIVDGAACDVGDAGPNGELACATARGICGCTAGPDGAHAHPRRWVCVATPDGCPATRPLLGQPCEAAMRCDYGACAFARGAMMSCEDGVWKLEAAACP